MGIDLANVFAILSSEDFRHIGVAAVRKPVGED